MGRIYRHPSQLRVGVGLRHPAQSRGRIRELRTTLTTIMEHYLPLTILFNIHAESFLMKTYLEMPINIFRFYKFLLDFKSENYLFTHYLFIYVDR